MRTVVRGQDGWHSRHGATGIQDRCVPDTTGEMDGVNAHLFERARVQEGW